MSLIAYDLAVPARTPERSAVSATIPIDRPVVVGCEIAFPDGPLGTLGIRLLDRQKQFAPDPRGSNTWILDNDRNVSWPEDHELDGPPWEIRVEGYNLAADHQHTAQIRIQIVDFSMAELLDRLNRNIERLTARIR